MTDTNAVLAERALQAYFDGDETGAARLIAQVAPPPGPPAALAPAPRKPPPAPPPPPPPPPSVAAVPRSRPRVIWYETYCLLCGRGVGPGGVLVFTPNMPRAGGHCSVCGGFLLVRQDAYALTPIVRPVVHTHPFRKVA